MIRYVPALMILALASCRPAPDVVNLDLPPTPILTNSSRWGVVTESYVRVLAGPGETDRVFGTLRADDIVEVTSQEVDPETGRYWTYVSREGLEGWIPREAMDLYDSASQARTASGG